MDKHIVQLAALTSQAPPETGCACADIKAVQHLPPA